MMIANADPVAAGLVESLAVPGRNITGLATLSADLSGKRLEMLTETIPRISRVGVLHDGDSQNTGIAYKEYDAAAKALKISLHPWKCAEQALISTGHLRAPPKSALVG